MPVVRTSKKIGYDINYPKGCKPLSDDIRPEELKKRISDLESKLSELAEIERSPGEITLAMLPMDAAGVAAEHEHDDDDQTTNHETNIHDNYTGLFLLLMGNQFIENESMEIKYSVACCLCSLMKICHPLSPLNKHSEENHFIKKFLLFIIELLQELENVNNKSDRSISWLSKIIASCCTTDIFLWVGQIDDGSEILENILRTVFLIVKRIPIWVQAGDKEMMQQQLLSIICNLIAQRESLLKAETVIYLLHFLLDPARSTQPLQYKFACSILQQEAHHLEYHIQIILQRALLHGLMPMQGSATSGGAGVGGSTTTTSSRSPRKKSTTRTTPVDLDSSTQEEDVDREAAVFNSSASPKNVSIPLFNDLGEQIFLVIYELHRIRESLVSSILPSLEVKLRSNEIKDRKRAVRLLGKLFTEPNSSLHMTHPTLFEALLTKFSDKEPEIREICVKMTPSLLRNNNDISHVELCRALRLRIGDTNEDVRYLCVHTIAEILTDWHTHLLSGEVIEHKLHHHHPPLAPNSATTKQCADEINKHHELALELHHALLNRARDTALTVRKEAISSLAALYRKALQVKTRQQQTTSITTNAAGTVSGPDDVSESSNVVQRPFRPLTDSNLLRSSVNAVLHLYYQDECQDKISVERLYKSYLVPYSQASKDRMQSLVLLYSLIDDSSVKVLQEMFKVQFSICFYLREVTILLRNASCSTSATASGTGTGTTTTTEEPPRQKPVKGGKRKAGGGVGGTAASGPSSDAEQAVEHRDVKERIATLASFLPQANAHHHSTVKDKTVEYLKKFFQHVYQDKAIQRSLLLLTHSKSPCKNVTEALKDILRRECGNSLANNAAATNAGAGGGGASGAGGSHITVTYASTIKALLERAAPVMMDVDAGQELIPLLVVARESASNASSSTGAVGATPAGANASDATESISLERSLKLLYAIAYYYKDTLPVADTIEYLVSVLKDLTSAEPHQFEIKESTTSSSPSSQLPEFTSTNLRDQLFELSLQILTCLLNVPKLSGSSNSNNNVVDVVQSQHSSIIPLSSLGASTNPTGLLTNAMKTLRRHLPNMLALLSRCCTEATLDQNYDPRQTLMDALVNLPTTPVKTTANNNSAAEDNVAQQTKGAIEEEVDEAVVEQQPMEAQPSSPAAAAPPPQSTDRRTLRKRGAAAASTVKKGQSNKETVEESSSSSSVKKVAGEIGSIETGGLVVSRPDTQADHERVKTQILDALGNLWKHQRKRAKLAIRVLIALSKSLHATTGGGGGENVDLQPNESSTLALVDDCLLDIVKICLSCTLKSPAQVSCLVTLGQIALLQPMKYQRPLRIHAKSMLRRVILEREKDAVVGSTTVDPLQSSIGEEDGLFLPASPSAIVAEVGGGTTTATTKGTEEVVAIGEDGLWTHDGALTHALLTKMEVVKFCGRWLFGLKTDEKDTVRVVLGVCYKLILTEGDILQNKTLTGGEKSRLRLAAALCWLKLAHHQNYVDCIDIHWFQTMACVICDPCREVRMKFLMKLHRGLMRLRLPLEYMAIFAHVANGPPSDLDFRIKAKQRLQFNVQRRREFLNKNPNYSNEAKLLYAVLPEYMLTYAVHLLAHDPDWTDIEDKSKLVRLKGCMWFILEPLIVKGNNFSFLRKLIERMKHTRDALDPDNDIANKKLYIMCDIALGLVMTKSTDFVLKEYPVEVRLPRSLYTPAHKGFVNPEFVHLSDLTVAPDDNANTDNVNGKEITSSANHKGEIKTTNTVTMTVTGAATDSTTTTTATTTTGSQERQKQVDQGIRKKVFIQFTPIKNSRAVKEGLLPMHLVKPTGKAAAAAAAVATAVVSATANSAESNEETSPTKTATGKGKPTATTKTAATSSISKVKKTVKMKKKQVKKGKKQTSKATTTTTSAATTTTAAAAATGKKDQRSATVTKTKVVETKQKTTPTPPLPPASKTSKTKASPAAATATTASGKKKSKEIVVETNSTPSLRRRPRRQEEEPTATTTTTTTPGSSSSNNISPVKKKSEADNGVETVQGRGKKRTRTVETTPPSPPPVAAAAAASSEPSSPVKRLRRSTSIGGSETVTKAVAISTSTPMSTANTGKGQRSKRQASQLAMLSLFSTPEANRSNAK